MMIIQKQWVQTISQSVGSSVSSLQERNTFNYPSLSKMRQKLPTAIHLSLCIVLRLSPDPPVWPLLCLMLCQHHLPLWSTQAQKQTFLLSCRWLMWLKQEATTIPLHSHPSTTTTLSTFLWTNEENRSSVVERTEKRFKDLKQFLILKVRFEHECFVNSSLSLCVLVNLLFGRRKKVIPRNIFR